VYGPRLFAGVQYRYWYFLKRVWDQTH
jgi:hypothetical protein